MSKDTCGGADQAAAALLPVVAVVRVVLGSIAARTLTTGAAKAGGARWR